MPKCLDCGNSTSFFEPVEESILVIYNEDGDIEEGIPSEYVFPFSIQRVCAECFGEDVADA